MPSLRALWVGVILFAVPGFAAAPPSAGDPKIRAAAQRAVRFLAQTAVAWQADHGGCYGCHVQAVTIEGLSVARHHQYDIPGPELVSLIENLTVGKTGIRSAGGLSPSTFPKTSRTFAGAGLGRYDKYVDGNLRDDLLKICRELLPIQRTDGAVVGDHPVMGPVASGTMQTTYQSMLAWRQCYARTADDAWRAPLRNAEAFVAKTLKSWHTQEKTKRVALQDLNHALMALAAAGAGGNETATAALVKELLARQGKDGGWAFGATERPMTDNFLSTPDDDKNTANPLATGQTVYALRQMGMTDAHPAVARAIRWLISHQHRNGGWGSTGAAKAEAMWAVLGLVSVDVLTVSIRGITDGERTEKGARVIVEVKDNAGGEVKEVALYVDDQLAAKVSGPELSHPLPELSAGKHLIDAVATNAKGQVSRRRVEVFAGDVFLTQLGARFDEAKQQTEVTLRNIAPAEAKGTVELEVFQLGEKDSEAKPGERVHTGKAPSAPGPVSLGFSGENGRYLARVTYKDAAGKALQTESQVFFHASEQVQRERTSEIEGQLGLGKSGSGSGLASNSVVELVDEDGRVVQSTRSNEQGTYRFKAVPKGTYKVRAKKEGFRDLESAPVAAEPAQAPAAASMSW